MRTTEKGEEPQGLPPSVPTLCLVYSGDAGAVAPAPRVLRTGETPIGRDVLDTVGIGLPQDRRASRRHATIHADAGAGSLSVLDEGSRNRTFVNGRPVTRGPLAEGDLLRIGDSFLVVRHEPHGDAALDAGVEGLLGTAPAIRAARHAIRLLAPSGASVLLLGESGCGKEVAAQAIHKASGRGGPLVAVNCSTITGGLAESQLFGHEPGAFTDARGARPGFFRQAEGGTLFLDELGELPLAVQAKLLRAVEERAVVPVGAARPVPCDVRLITATNRDLQREVQAGRFRGDLYARVAEVPVHLPPLRERREDILPLLLRALGPAIPRPRLSPRLVEALLLHPWPYNVRELFKIATQLRLYGGAAKALDLALVQDRLLAPGPTNEPAPGPQHRPPRPTREELSALLREHRGNIAHVASAVGRSRRQVDRWLAEYQLDGKAFRR